MRAGRMRTRLKLQERSAGATRDAAGNPSTTWTTTETVWAARMDFGTGQGEGEDEAGGQQHGTVSGAWRIRHRSTVTPKGYRAVEADSTGAVWDIQAAIDPTGKREETILEVVRRGV